MRSPLGILLATIATPVAAQQDHGTASHAAADPHAQHQADEQPVDPHAEHVMPSEPPAQTDPHAGHVMPSKPSEQADPHAGHEMPSAPSIEAQEAHAGHEAGIPDPPVTPPSVAASSGPAHAADAIFGAAAMASAREVARREHGDIRSSMILIDRLETVVGKGKDGYAWEAQGWYGGDIDKLWVKTEGESTFGESLESIEMQALWSHALDPWWNLQAGVRHDFRAGPDRTYAVVGVQGLAPYWFEIDGSVFLSDRGDITARFEAEYDQRLTRKLILQPVVEIDFSAQDIPELGIGSGLSTAELGLRLRYQIVPEFAPYVGVKYEHAFGDTANFRRARGEQAGGWNFLVGIRSWF